MKLWCRYALRWRTTNETIESRHAAMLPRMAMFGLVDHERDRALDEVDLALADRVGADRLLELEHEPGADRLDDRGRAALLAEHRIGDVAVLLVVDVRDRAAAGRAGDGVGRPGARLTTSTPGVCGPPMNLCGEMNTASLYASRLLVDRSSRSRRTARPRRSPRTSSAPCWWSSVERSRAVSVAMPVTFDAAEKLPILSGRAANAHELLLEVGEIDVAVGVLVDHDDVGDRLAPRQLVGVVLERPDEHDRALGLGDPARQRVARVEIRRDRGGS